MRSLLLGLGKLYFGLACLMHILRLGVLGFIEDSLCPHEENKVAMLVAIVCQGNSGGVER